jgi:hypothetical protein
MNSGKIIPENQQSSVCKEHKLRHSKTEMSRRFQKENDKSTIRNQYRNQTSQQNHNNIFLKNLNTDPESPEKL